MFYSDGSYFVPPTPASLSLSLSVCLCVWWQVVIITSFCSLPDFSAWLVDTGHLNAMNTFLLGTPCLNLLAIVMINTHD